MDGKQACVKCGGVNVHPGTLPNLPAYKQAFLPDGATIWSIKTSTVVVDKARVCLDCGFLELSCDPTAVKAILERVNS
jgi:hypothetical protein